MYHVFTTTLIDKEEKEMMMTTMTMTMMMIMINQHNDRCKRVRK